MNDLTEPATVAEITDLLTSLGVNTVDAAIAAIFPQTTIPDFDVDRPDLFTSQPTYRWRNHAITVDPHDHIPGLCALAAAGWQSGDVRPELTAHPVNGVRIVHTGTNKHCFGTNALLRLPNVVADAALSDIAIREALTSVVTTRTSGVCATSDGPVLIQCNDHLITLHEPDTQPAAPTGSTFDAAVAALGELTSTFAAHPDVAAVDVTWTSPDETGPVHATYTLTITSTAAAHVVSFPATMTATTATIGHAPHDYMPTPPTVRRREDVVDHLVVEGRDVFDDSVYVRWEAFDVIARLHTTTNA